MFNDVVIVKELSNLGALQHCIKPLAPRAPRRAEVNQYVLLFSLCGLCGAVQDFLRGCGRFGLR
jgi:hypothetical protein